MTRYYQFAIFTILSSTFLLSHAVLKTNSFPKKDNNPSLGLNNIDKNSKKGMGELNSALVTPLAEIPAVTTVPSHFQMGTHNHNHTVANSPTQEQLEIAANAHVEDRMRRIVEMTVLICGITVILVVFFLSIRISAHLYRKFKLYTNQRLGVSSNRNEPSVHYTTSGPHHLGEISPHNSSTTTTTTSTSGTGSIYTVMPGHFVLQPCFTSTTGSSRAIISQRPPLPPGRMDDGGGSLSVGTVEAPFRPETPPPPYPGPLKDAEKNGKARKNKEANP